ncbi:MAG: UDP-N-acetylmuramoyl-L-alanine--D-glutamate ligase [Alphaproteobacteria bacterium]|nr:UDP-N-acetylmuramoyl-L-alanine--D-glutamate ligase [Alphaproteobacteria bacterium]
MLVGKRVTVIGAGLSGRGAARLALHLGAKVVLTDARADLTPLEGAECVFGQHRDADLEQVDLVVVSPGVPPRVPPVQRALAAGVEVIGELGFAHRFLPPELPIVAVTGTNGKSSVVSFVGQLFQAAGVPAFVGGNLGTPLSELARRGGDGVRVAVVEVSSYQLELPGAFRAHAAALLNLTPDHLARHGTMREYGRMKARIFDRMGPGDLAAVPHDDPLLIELTENLTPPRAWLGAQPGLSRDGEGYRIFGAPLRVESPSLVGDIPRWNAAVACLLASRAGAAALPLASLDTRALRPLPHRMEPVGELDGVLWINDSKATNVEAALAGLRSLDRDAVVLLGGEGKAGADYAALRPPLAERARAVICFGQSGPEIGAALGGLPVELSPGLSSAVELARSRARRGQAVLLSPACASFDEFENFERRGEAFRRLALRGGA